MTKQQKGVICLETSLNTKNMSNTNISANSIDELLFQTGSVKVTDEPIYLVKKKETRVPVKLEFQELFKKPSSVEKAAEMMVELINSNNDSRKMVAGFGFDGIPLAYEIAKKLDTGFIPLQKSWNGLIEGYDPKNRFPLQNESVILITGILATGQNTNEAEELLKSAKAEVHRIYAIFDYGFNLSSKNLQHTELHIRSLTTMQMMIEKSGNEGAKTWLQKAFFKKLERSHFDPTNKVN